jgi:hypothetical protein
LSVAGKEAVALESLELVKEAAAVQDGDGVVVSLLLGCGVARDEFCRVDFERRGEGFSRFWAHGLCAFGAPDGAWRDVGGRGELFLRPALLLA